MKYLLKLASAMIFLAMPAMAEDTWLTLPEPPALPAPASSGMAEVNGISMYYATYGEGDPVLLIHGGLGQSGVWGFLVPELMDDHKVIIADTRGHGRSTIDDRPLDFKLLAADYLALLDTIGIEKTALVGWSDGGIIGLELAQTHPERLTKVYALGSNASPAGSSDAGDGSDIYATFGKQAYAAYQALSPTPDAWKNFAGRVVGMWKSEPNYTDADLASITVPVTIAAGDREEAILDSHTRYMAATIPGAKLVMLKDTSHFALVQDPETFAETVKLFLAE